MNNFTAEINVRCNHWFMGSCCDLLLPSFEGRRVWKPAALTKKRLLLLLFISSAALHLFATPRASLPLYQLTLLLTFVIVYVCLFVRVTSLLHSDIRSWKRKHDLELFIRCIWFRNALFWKFFSNVRAASASSVNRAREPKCHQPLLRLRERCRQPQEVVDSEARVHVPFVHSDVVTWLPR